MTGDLEYVFDYLLTVWTAFALIEQIQNSGAMTFCLLVEEPLIDFDPLQSCLLNSLTASLPRHLALVFIKNLTEGRELFFTFMFADRLSQFLLAFQLPHFLNSF